MREGSISHHVTRYLSMLVVLAMVMVPLFTTCYSAAGGDETTQRSDGFSKVDPAKDKVVPHQGDLDLRRAYQGAESNQALSAVPGGIYDIGARASFLFSDWGKWYYNETNPSDYMTIVKRAESNHSEVWVAEDLLYWEGDERNALVSQIGVTDDHVEYLAEEFEKNIYPTLSEFVSPAPPRDGENSIPKSIGQPYFGTNVSGRVMIVIFNIVDGDFYYPGGGYLGMYSPPMAEYYDRNIVFMDSWDWNNRTGPQPEIPYDHDHVSYGYERTLTHEYEHALGDYANTNQVQFLSEGSSVLAELLCGYPLEKNERECINAFLSLPDNSLTEWGDQGFEWADYGAAILFMTYLYDQFGLPLVHNLVVTNLTGVDSINAAFQAVGLFDWDMNRAFNSWRLTNLIRSDTPGRGLYNYRSFDLNDDLFSHTTVLNWNPSKDPSVNSASDYFGRSYYPDWEYFLPTSKSGAYGTEYIRVVGSEGGNWAEGLDTSGLKFGLNGQSQAFQGWQVVDQPIGMKELLFSEDFNDGGSLSGWETESFGVTQHPWYLSTSDGSDYFAVANADEMGPETVDMWELIYMTSGFSTIGMTELGLRFDIDFHKVYWWDIAKVLYSVDGGTTWEQLTNYTDSTNEIGPMPMSLSSEIYLDFSRACGKEDVRLAFEYFTTSWGYWFAIDNIQVGTIIKEKMWWSDARDLRDYSMYANLDLTDLEDAVLSFDSKWSIEYGYDFGFVQVSSDDGATWTSVGNEYSSDQAMDWADTNIIQYLPGITGNSPFDGMGHVSYDLSEWSGQKIILRIRMMTDWAATYNGWYIDNVSLSGELIDDASDHHALVSDIPPVDIDWLVTIYLPSCIGTDGTRYLPIIMTLQANEFGDHFQRHLTSFTVYQQMYLIISPIAGPCDYSFWMENYEA